MKSKRYNNGKARLRAYFVELYGVGLGATYPKSHHREMHNFTVTSRQGVLVSHMLKREAKEELEIDST